MNRIKTFIKREKFLSVCVLIIVAMLLFMLVYSYFPTIVKTDTCTAIMFIGFVGGDFEKEDGEVVPGFMFFKDANEKTKFLNVNFSIYYDGYKTDEWKKLDVDTTDAYMRIHQDKFKEIDGDTYFNYGSYIAYSHYKQFPGGVFGETLYLKKYYTKVVFDGE